MKRSLSAFLGFLFVFFLLLVPFKAPAESVTYEPSHWTEKNDEYETRYTLQDSTLYSAWTDSCGKYKCYVYALDEYPKYGDEMIGAFCGKTNKASSYLNNAELDALSSIVMQDLSALGNVCIKKTSTLSEAVNLPAAYNVICLRITTGGQHRDFHFMKYNRSLGAWLHKPGHSAILKYKYTPSASRVWTNERYMEDGAKAGFVTYNSPIWFFAFSSSHHYSVQSQGDSSAHIMKCKGCNDTIRKAHILNAATNACKICGRSAPFTTDKSIPVEDVLSIDVLLPSSEALYNEAHGVNKSN